MLSKSEIRSLWAAARSLNLNEGVNAFGFAASAFADGDEAAAMEQLAAIERAARKAGDAIRQARAGQAERNAQGV